jgi:hypothetical protein
MQAQSMPLSLTPALSRTRGREKWGLATDTRQTQELKDDIRNADA